ncbi:MAG TPA: pyridoxal phosphate-dependent aminotransferase [Gemmatimonadales bacterium]
MGVIWVVAEAMKRGFRNGDPDWCNLGQGQPEVGTIEGAPERISTINLEPHDHAYGPIGGTDEMRQLVADHYNRLYRRDRASKYTRDNVTVASGGRLTLSRVFATLGAVRVGYQVPDYTAYEDMLDYHRYRITPVAVPTTVESGFVTPATQLDRVVRDRRLDAFLLSNPCNPTGQLVRDDELAGYVRIARERHCTMILDEFYSHFVYTPAGAAGAGPVSGAAFVEDVERDSVLLIDGLTKSFRYPGWRLGWVVGPADVIELVNRAASAIDGGPSTAVQRAACQVLEPARADRETTALRSVFVRKRNLMLERLRAMGIVCPHAPGGTFYVWADIGNLPPPLNDADRFFRAALDRKVLTVPGRFFDVNPGGERVNGQEYQRWVRFSFGPPADNVRLGLDRLAELIAEA